MLGTLGQSLLAAHTDTSERAKAAAHVHLEANARIGLFFGEIVGTVQLAALLAQDLEALAFVRIPQFPSSRAFGDAPAVTTREYEARIPNDPALVQIVPVPPRPFPAALRDPDLLPPSRHPSAYAVATWGIVAIVGIPLLLWRAWRRHRR